MAPLRSPPEALSWGARPLLSWLVSDPHLHYPLHNVPRCTGSPTHFLQIHLEGQGDRGSLPQPPVMDRQDDPLQLATARPLASEWEAQLWSLPAWKALH